MIVVGLTGGIASGKSTVSDMFCELGARLIDYDILAREVVEPGQKAWKAIVEEFGPEVLNEDSSINREKLGQIVFDNPDKLQRLNQIVHPAVFEEADRRVQEFAETNPDAMIIKDIPLLIETGIQNNKVDKVVVVAASMENRLQRLMDRGLTKTDAKKRIATQMPTREKVEFADFVIDNDGSVTDTNTQVKQIYDTLMHGRDK